MGTKGALVRFSMRQDEFQAPGRGDQVQCALGVSDTLDPSPKHGVETNQVAVDQRMPTQDNPHSP